ncbi:MAG: tetratricopeptide repeat protein [Bacteroidales bacterium]|nr:tetratricopeptide repeat protein [Bacteroidales bacterium]MDD4640566.1 tetratricopeptide repeat protein [Bacteroidales bacterium]
MRSLFIYTFLFLFSLTAIAQKAERKHIREGNNLFEEEKFTEAEIEYRKALEVDRQSPEGIFNLGNALFKQEKPQEAIEQYQQITGTGKDSVRLSSAWHNMGNSFMQAQDFGKAIDAYKQALIHNYKDDQTRYNLAVAQAMLKKQQEQQQQQQQQQQEQEQEQEQQQEQQEQQEQERPEQQNQADQQEQQQEQISREKAQQLLDALMQDEQEVQEKVKKLQMQNSRPKKTEKDW